MNSKKFEYFHKDIKQLKIDIIFRMIFSTLFLIAPVIIADASVSMRKDIIIHNKYITYGAKRK